MPTDITVRPDPAEPVAFDFGRERTVFVNPYTGEMLGEGSQKLRAFFSTVEDFHRWLGVGGERRTTGRAVTGACNLSLPHSGDERPILVVAEGMDLEQPEKNHVVSRRSPGFARAIGIGTTFWASGVSCLYS